MTEDELRGYLHRCTAALDDARKDRDLAVRFLVQVETLITQGYGYDEIKLAVRSALSLLGVTREVGQ